MGKKNIGSIILLVLLAIGFVTGIGLGMYLFFWVWGNSDTFQGNYYQEEKRIYWSPWRIN